MKQKKLLALFHVVDKQTVWDESLRRIQLSDGWCGLCGVVMYLMVFTIRLDGISLVVAND